jgi:hypothetical protein
MAEIIYNCTLEKFNKEVSKYLYGVFGEPRIERDQTTQKFNYLSYSLPEEDIGVDVSIFSDYKRKGDKYSLESKATIFLNLKMEKMGSPIKEKLEEMLEKK